MNREDTGWWTTSMSSRSMPAPAASAIVPPALVVPVLGADAAMDRLLAALGIVEFVGLGGGVGGLVAVVAGESRRASDLLPGRGLAVVRALGLEQLPRVGQRLAR